MLVVWEGVLGEGDEKLATLHMLWSWSFSGRESMRKEATHFQEFGSLFPALQRKGCSSVQLGLLGISPTFFIRQLADFEKRVYVGGRLDLHV